MYSHNIKLSSVRGASPSEQTPLRTQAHSEIPQNTIYMGSCSPPPTLAIHPPPGGVHPMGGNNARCVIEISGGGDTKRSCSTEQPECDCAKMHKQDVRDDRCCLTSLCTLLVIVKGLELKFYQFKIETSTMERQWTPN